LNLHMEVLTSTLSQDVTSLVDVPCSLKRINGTLRFV
jgi:hypothetical protein